MTKREREHLLSALAVMKNDELIKNYQKYLEEMSTFVPEVEEMIDRDYDEADIKERKIYEDYEYTMGQLYEMCIEARGLRKEAGEWKTQ